MNGKIFNDTKTSPFVLSLVEGLRESFSHRATKPVVYRRTCSRAVPVPLANRTSRRRSRTCIVGVFRVLFLFRVPFGFLHRN